MRLVYHGVVLAFRHDIVHPGVPRHLVHPLGLSLSHFAGFL